MKTIAKLLVFTLIVILAACSKSTIFPVSKITPAANITAKKSMNDQDNFTLEIIAENLASAERLNPPGKNYSVWIVTTNNRVKNVGQLNVENSEKSTFKTVTAFDFNEIFITVEDQGDLNYPIGVEIARTRIN